MVTIDKSLPLLPLDIQFFNKIKKDNFLYIDKTGLIAQLINSKLTYFFLSRPRRFGKSLLISTMKEIFSGNKELFKNLQVYKRNLGTVKVFEHGELGLAVLAAKIPGLCSAFPAKKVFFDFFPLQKKTKMTIITP